MALTEIDRRLLKQCLAQAPGAWHDFVDRFIGLFVHVIHHTAHARSVKLTPDDVDDLCSEILLTLLKNDFAILRHFRGQSSLATYLTVIARRIAVREIVQRRKAEAMGHVAAHHAAFDATNGEGDNSPPRLDNAEQVRSLLNQLPAPDAQIVRMFHLEGKSYREISSSLGIPENTIGPTLSRAREQMRRSGLQSV